MSESAKDLVFVLMPLDDASQNTWYALQQQKELYPVTVERADDPAASASVMEHIYQLIDRAAVVVADLTGSRPNVLYELGYARAIGKPLVLLAPSHEEVPFDLREHDILQLNKFKGVPLLIEEISRRLKASLVRSGSFHGLRTQLLESLRLLTRSNVMPSPLFESLIELKTSGLAEDVEHYASGTIWVAAPQIKEKGLKVLLNLKKGGFATWFDPLGDFWSDKDNIEYVDGVRTAAQREDVEIERVYILTDDHAIRDPRLSELVRKDEDATIVTYICFLEDLPPETFRDFGIWDEELLCVVDDAAVDGARLVTNGLFSIDPERMDQANRSRAAIRKVMKLASPLIAATKAHDLVPQPLVLSAPEMARQAAQHCERSYLGSNGCIWYHENWQYLRLVNAVSTPDWHADFYRNKITDAAKKMMSDSPRRVLVCGAADYGMLAHLLAALPLDETNPWEAFVLDTCPTPLQMCKWYAKQMKTSTTVRIHEGDARALPFQEDYFSLVVTDAFVTRFEGADQEHIVSEWARSLVPGGSVITTIRTTNGGGERIVANEGERNAFAQKAFEEAEKLFNSLPCLPDEMREKALMYAEKMVSYPLSKKATRALFKKAGMKVQTKAESVKGEFAKTTYLRVVATLAAP